MRKWLKIGAAVMLLAWLPFVYAELTSSPAEKKARELPSDELEDTETAVGAAHAPGAGEHEHAEQAPAEEPAPAEPAPVPAEEGKDQPAEAAHEGEDEVAAAPTPSPVPAAPPDEAVPAEPDPADEGDEEAEEEAAPPPVASGPTAVFKHAYETEPRDALWAADTEARIAAVFRGEDVPAGMLEKASCRRAVCKLDIRWTRDHAAQYVSVYQTMREQFGNELAVEPVGELDEEAGQQLVHLYVPRKGYTASDLSR